MLVMDRGAAGRASHTYRERMLRLTRRTALITLGAAAGVAAAAGTGVALVEAAVLPGKSTLDRTLGRCAAPVPAGSLRSTPGPLVTGRLRSVRRRREVDFVISYPPGYRPGAALPVCLALHGY